MSHHWFNDALIIKLMNVERGLKEYPYPSYVNFDCFWNHGVFRVPDMTPTWQKWVYIFMRDGGGQRILRGHEIVFWDIGGHIFLRNLGGPRNFFKNLGGQRKFLGKFASLKIFSQVFWGHEIFSRISGDHHFFYGNFYNPLTKGRHGGMAY